MWDTKTQDNAGHDAARDLPRGKWSRGSTKVNSLDAKR